MPLPGLGCPDGRGTLCPNQGCSFTDSFFCYGHSSRRCYSSVKPSVETFLRSSNVLSIFSLHFLGRKHFGTRMGVLECFFLLKTCFCCWTKAFWTSWFPPESNFTRTRMISLPQDRSTPEVDKTSICCGYASKYHCVEDHNEICFLFIRFCLEINTQACALKCYDSTLHSQELDCSELGPC